MDGLKIAIKAEAKKLGFLLAGVTTPDPPPHFDVFTRWLEAGRHGEMSYLESERSLERRAHPLEILPECKSILALAAPYNPPPPISAEPEGRGKVASYAWGDDYHEVLPAKLKALVSFIEARVGHLVPNRWYTDTGPILERDLAQRAGLGWIGKNTMLISPQHGSYFLLAEILLGIDLEPDMPVVADHCGTCTRCIEACPTGCILPDRTIDAARCISYLTIELKGSIPEDQRSKIGDHVFGCDVCQQACPWNERFSGQGSEAGKLGAQNFPLRRGIPYPDLTQELSLTPEEFNLKFKGSPVKRAKRRGYLRSAAVVLGNCPQTADARVVQALQLAASDEEPLVREHASFALQKISFAAGSKE